MKQFTYCTICGLKKPQAARLSLVICRDRDHEAREHYRDVQLAKGGSIVHKCPHCKECDVYPEYEFFCPNCGRYIGEKE